MSEVTTAMEWRTIPVGDLHPAAYNPRKKLKPGDKEYEKIKKSIQSSAMWSLSLSTLI